MRTDHGVAQDCAPHLCRVCDAAGDHGIWVNRPGEAVRELPRPSPSVVPVAERQETRRLTLRRVAPGASGPMLHGCSGQDEKCYGYDGNTQAPPAQRPARAGRLRSRFHNIITRGRQGKSFSPGHVAGYMFFKCILAGKLVVKKLVSTIVLAENCRVGAFPEAGYSSSNLCKIDR